ncbi:alpha amylase C-terminal domain-containing protein [Cellulomonas hominis]
MQDPAGAVLDAVCPDDAGPDAPRADGEWVCQHRWDVVTGMVGWRAAVTAGERAAPMEDFWSEGEAIAFSRGARGLVVVNAEDTPLAAEIPTTLPDGDYCDVTVGPIDPVGPGGAGTCPGETVEVRSGVATVTVASRSALAVHVGAPAG